MLFNSRMYGFDIITWGPDPNAFIISGWDKPAPTGEDSLKHFRSTFHPFILKLLEHNIKLNTPLGAPFIPQEAHDRTAILCGAGPSLSKILSDPAIQTADIYACNLAAKVVKGLPNFKGMITMDPGYAPDFDVPAMYAAISASHDAVKKCTNPVQFFGMTDSYAAGADPSIPLVTQATSVGPVALHLLYRLGYRNVILAGMDFSAILHKKEDGTFDGVYYCDGRLISQNNGDDPSLYVIVIAPNGVPHLIKPMHVGQIEQMLAAAASFRKAGGTLTDMSCGWFN